MIGIYLHYAIRLHYENYLLHEWEFEIFLKVNIFFFFVLFISYCSKQAEKRLKI